MTNEKKSIRILLIILFLILAVSATVMADNRLYRAGMQGPTIKNIQENLNHVGYQIDVDGIFGEDTENAVREFQKKYGLDVDGIVGNETLNILNDLPTTVRHVVAPGDTLTSIALRYGTSIETIIAANDLSSDSIYVDQKLTVPHAKLVSFEYVVEPGDNLTRLAEKFGSTVEAIKEVNQLNSDNIRAGTRLTITHLGAGGDFGNYTLQEITHVVRPGETLSGIASRYGISTATIRNVNGLRSNMLWVGQKLSIPNQKVVHAGGRLQPGTLTWPVRGQISSPFGWRTHPVYQSQQFHGGIDIAVNTGSPVRAAAGGFVAESGWKGGFGNTLIIDHGHDISTLYAHNSQLLVQSGERVYQGQVVARSGNTGVSTGPHLHFEIRIDGDAVDPMDWLP